MKETIYLPSAKVSEHTVYFLEWFELIYDFNVSPAISETYDLLISSI